MDSLTTYMEVKDYLTRSIDRAPKGKVPTGAQQNVWMTIMAAPSDNFNEVFPSVVLGDA